MFKNVLELPRHLTHLETGNRVFLAWIIVNENSLSEEQWFNKILKLGTSVYANMGNKFREAKTRDPLAKMVAIKLAVDANSDYIIFLVEFSDTTEAVYCKIAWN